jgi:hypothetical protein
MLINNHGEIINDIDYIRLEDIFNKEILTEEEKLLIQHKTRCACGLIVSISGLKSHVSSSNIHKKRMNKFRLSDKYIHPHSPYSRVPKKIEKFNEKIIINFD